MQHWPVHAGYKVLALGRLVSILYHGLSSGLHNFVVLGNGPRLFWLFVAQLKCSTVLAFSSTYKANSLGSKDRQPRAMNADFSSVRHCSLISENWPMLYILFLIHITKETWCQATANWICDILHVELRIVFDQKWKRFFKLLLTSSSCLVLFSLSFCSSILTSALFVYQPPSPASYLPLPLDSYPLTLSRTLSAWHGLKKYQSDYAKL